jgi:RimJ/RimL family protein N-acetyltransferase
MSNIIYSGSSSKGREYIIRYVEAGDVAELHRFINEISAERTFISFQGEEISMEEEEKYVTSQLEKIAQQKAVQLVVQSEGKIVGNADVIPQIRAENHIGIFGIIIHKDYRGEGIGKKLMELVLLEVEKNVPDIKMIKLGVLANNPLAQNMYAKFGFQECGRLPKGFRYRDTYVDHIFMYKEVR